VTWCGGRFGGSWVCICSSPSWDVSSRVWAPCAAAVRPIAGVSVPFWAPSGGCFLGDITREARSDPNQAAPTAGLSPVRLRCPNRSGCLVVAAFTSAGTSKKVVPSVLLAPALAPRRCLAADRLAGGGGSSLTGSPGRVIAGG